MPHAHAVKEREVKLGAGPGFHVPDLAGVADGVTVDQPVELRLDTVYFDTADLRIARWGCSLRHRGAEGWTLKLPSAIDGAALEREELTVAGDRRSGPPAALVSVVRAYVRGEPLVAVARLSTTRSLTRLRDESGRPLAEVVDDRVSVLDGRRIAARFRELEVELKEGDENLLQALVDRLHDSGAGASDPTPKNVRALGPAAQAPPEVTVPDVTRAATASTVITAALAGPVVSLMRHDPGIRVGGDPEHVHQVRVATRRLRSDLRIFAPLLDPEWAARLREELGWLGQALGEVRDSEVLLDRLRGRLAELPESDRPAGEQLLERLAEETDAKRKALRTAMDSQRYIDLVAELVAAARSPAVTADGERPAADVVVGLARKPWKRLRKAVRALADEPADAELHRVRILAKRARYAAEAVAPVAGGKAAAFGRELAALQTVLGEHQDSVTAQAWLRAAARSVRQAFVAGELVAIERAAAARARRQWRAVWKAARRPALRRWLA
jgi:CHAD domain-containing protein